MTLYLQIILFVTSSLFTVYVMMMVKRKKLQLSYSILWILTGVSFVLLSIFPQVLDLVANVLQIQTPVNALFLIIIFFLLLIIFTLTLVLSKLKIQVTNLSQSLGLLKEELNKGESISK
ncbi:MAG: DUF2304 domain-containing protein [Sarcina sp.]